MAGRNFLFVPGPTNVPDRILRAMDRAMEDHRSSAFPALASGLLRDLKSVFKTTAGQPFIFPATGTGGWEAALVNTLSPGDRVLAPRYGQFSHLWIDLALTGSQKGLMLPPGLGLVCASPRALAAGNQAKCPRVFFDFGDMSKANATGYFPYTPSLPLLHGLRESLAMLFEEGLDNVFARHRRLADGVRAAVRAWGLKLCARAPKWHSDTVSAILVPDGFNAADVIDVAFRRYNLALGAGLARVAGKLFRIGHLGDLNELMLLGAIAGTEMAMRDVGIKVTLGAGVAAAAEHYRGSAAPLPPRAVAAPSADAQPQPQPPGGKPGSLASRAAVRA